MFYFCCSDMHNPGGEKARKEQNDYQKFLDECLDKARGNPHRERYSHIRRRDS